MLLVKTENIEEEIDRVGRKYRRQIGLVVWGR